METPIQHWNWGEDMHPTVVVTSSMKSDNHTPSLQCRGVKVPLKLQFLPVHPSATPLMTVRNSASLSGFLQLTEGNEFLEKAGGT